LTFQKPSHKCGDWEQKKSLPNKDLKPNDVMDEGCGKLLEAKG
jgi:hypothetical protein